MDARPSAPSLAPRVVLHVSFSLRPGRARDLMLDMRHLTAAWPPDHFEPTSPERWACRKPGRTKVRTISTSLARYKGGHT